MVRSQQGASEIKYEHWCFGKYFAKLWMDGKLKYLARGYTNRYVHAYKSGDHLLTDETEVHYAGKTIDMIGEVPLTVDCRISHVGGDEVDVRRDEVSGPRGGRG